jgi:guanylate cyclase soluble subunit beta
VRNRFGEKRWEIICSKAGFEDEEFIGLKSYPDQVTLDILQACSEELGIPVHNLMELCGETWIEHTAASGYENVLNLAGSNMVDFLYNLNLVHSRISHLMPDMRPPSFKVKKESAKTIQLLYQSDRLGMEPLAVGILRGLGRRFGHSVVVNILGADPDDPASTLFEITW